MLECAIICVVLKMKFKIGNLELENNLILAPMAGVSNSAFRIIARSKGAGLTYAEMVSDKGIFFDNEKTKSLLYSSKDEHPYAQQIFGSDLESLVVAAKYVNDHTDADIIDLNMGCPVSKVSIRAQAGAALMKDPQKIYEIITEIKKVINKPLTIKIRSGWDSDFVNAVEVAKAAERAKIDAIIIHGRTRKQMYSGKADLEIIKKVKQAVSVPVIGNGDIIDGVTAKRMLDETGVDAIMIGRAALGNPWIFDEINHYLKTGQQKDKPSIKEIKETLIYHYETLIKIKGEHLATLEIRGQGPYYFKGLKDAKKVRTLLTKINNRNEFYDVINTYFDELLAI